MISTRINLYAGPGCGKSVTATRLFSSLKIIWNKKEDPQVELVQEVIKEWAWLKIPASSWDQYYIFGSQIRKEDIILRHKTTHIITDSPVFMQLAYMKRGKLPYYQSCVHGANIFEKFYPSLHILLKRTVPYIEEGRYENYEQALEMDNLIKEELTVANIAFVEFDPVNEFEDILKLAKLWILLRNQE